MLNEVKKSEKKAGMTKVSLGIKIFIGLLVIIVILVKLGIIPLVV